MEHEEKDKNLLYYFVVLYLVYSKIGIRYIALWGKQTWIISYPPSFCTIAVGLNIHTFTNFNLPELV